MSPPADRAAGRDVLGDGPGGVNVASLMAVQRRHALRTLAIVLGGLAVLLGAPALGAAGVGCVPFGWPVLTAAVQPLWLVVALRHVRAAEQAERDLLRAARRRTGRARQGRGGQGRPPGCGPA